jgi:lysophospholipase
MRPLALLLLLAAGCRAPVSIPRDTPLDFDALPGPTTFATEATLAERWQGPLRAFWDSGRRGEFRGVDGFTLRYIVHAPASSRGAVVVLTGRTEPALKYAETLQELVSAGYTTYAFDHRGQGASDRLLPNPDKGHVEYFDDYVRDVVTLLETVVRPTQPGDVFLLAHSMGGGVAAGVADVRPELVTAMALSAPMLEIRTGGFPPSVAYGLAASACTISDPTGYALGNGDFQPETSFDANRVTRSQPRWQWAANLYQEFRSQMLGGVTYRWLCTSIGSSTRLAQSGAYSPVPTLLLQATDENFVGLASQDRYCADAPRCQKVVLEGARHELLAEVDAVRNRALSLVLKFFVARGTR